MNRTSHEYNRLSKFRRKYGYALGVFSLSLCFIYGIWFLESNGYKSYAESTSPKQVEKVAKPIMPTKSKKILSKTSGVFNPKIPMPIGYQEYLYKMCKKRGLNYKKALAVIHHESRFDPNKLSTTNDYGYFQINQVNHETLSRKLHTANSAFNPYINIDWGTYMLSNLYHYYESKGYSGSELDNAVWSSYNEGVTGYHEHGEATAYVEAVRESLVYITQRFSA